MNLNVTGMKEIDQFFQQPEAFPKLEYGKTSVLLGSCFSTHVFDRLRYYGFDSMTNPFGVTFHPLALAKQIEQSLQQDTSGKRFTLHDVYLHALASSEIYGMSEESLLERYAKAQLSLRSSLETANLLVLTFGSAHGYFLKETDEIVANCHKQPRDTFTKELSSVEEMVHVWKSLIEVLITRYPKLQIVLTVSPVRYTRDGILENIRSKGRLVELCHELSTLDGVCYFPSFELINDVLRDFSFFEGDRSHPNERAINQVWKLFESWSTNSATRNIMNQVAEIRSREQHKLLFPESEQSERFLADTNEKRERLRSQYSTIVW